MDFGELEGGTRLVYGDKLIVQNEGENVRYFSISPHTLYSLCNINTNWSGIKFSILRGQNLGTAVTDKQWEEIHNGTFKDIFIGDYWYIGNRVWRVLDFDYWYNIGPAGEENLLKKPHLVIAPQSPLYQGKMHNSDNNSTGYMNCDMRKTGLDSAKSMIYSAFGSDHIMPHKVILSNSVDGDGKNTGSIWADSLVDLMNENQLFGSSTCGLYNDKSDLYPFAWYRLTSKYRKFDRSAYWLRDTVRNGYVAYYPGGNIGPANATVELGVLPAFAIYAP